MKKSKLQQIFDTVIDKGFYNPAKAHCRYMCLSLRGAQYDRIISDNDLLFAKEEIVNYLNYLLSFKFKDIPCQCVTLSGALNSLNLPAQNSDLLFIYRNWHKRPHAKAHNAAKLEAVKLAKQIKL